MQARLGLVIAMLGVCAAACSQSADGSSSGAGGNGSGSGSGGSLPSHVTTGTGAGSLVLYGSPFTGGEYNLGPVDYEESQWHNACAPSTKYPAQIQKLEGTYLAGLWDGLPNVAQYCDACIWVTTDKGKSAMLRVVQYGATTPNSIDVSPDAYDLLNQGEYPRTMTWQFAECPDTGAMVYEFQTGSSEWWTSFWVRNPRVPLVKVEAKSQNHGFVELQRGTDGTLTDNGGFGVGPFSIRSTGMDGSTVTDSFSWPSNGVAGVFLTGKSNFP